jgi:hypothetical protein
MSEGQSGRPSDPWEDRQVKASSPRAARNMHLKLRLGFDVLSRFPKLFDRRNTRLRRSFLLHSGILMVEEPKTATEIARLIKERAYIQLGRWPVDLQLIIFSTTFGWR